MTILANTISPFNERYGVKSNYVEMVEKCGGNTGNVVFHDAIQQQIKFDREIISYTELETVKESNVCVLPAANWINSDGFVLNKIFGNLIRSDIQILVVGLGIQMRLGESISGFCDSLSKETVSALKTMSELSISIGVRGAATGDVLDCLGIHNWEVIGCPSFYEPYRKHIKMKQTKNISADKTAYNIKYASKMTDKILDFAVKEGSYIIIQDQRDLKACESIEDENVRGGGIFMLLITGKSGKIFC